MKIDGFIMHTKVLCINKQFLSGGIEVEKFVDMSFDIRDIQAVKHSGESDEEASEFDRAVVYLKGRQFDFILEDNFIDVVNAWSKTINY